MSRAPLTHHEILRIVEPFTRLGRRVDLTASDRVQRRLEFQPVKWRVSIADSGPAGSEPVTIEDALCLDCLATGSFRLTRRLSLPGRATATYEAVGVALGSLLAAVDSVAPERAFRTGDGYLIARSYSFEAVRSRLGSDYTLAPILVRGVILLEGLRLTLSLPTLRGIAADLALSPLELPEDLLAVLGWDWARLVRTADGWKSKLRLRGNLSRRSDRAEAALDRAAVHLARTLAEPPARFHDTWRAARWGVVLRRAIPVLTFVALLVVISALGRSGRLRGVGPWMLLFQLPTALIALSLSMQELASYEIPPWPRRPTGDRWQALR